eukprot:5057467-Prymnesium_polylepis.1
MHTSSSAALRAGARCGAISAAAAADSSRAASSATDGGRLYAPGGTGCASGCRGGGWLAV